MFKSLCFVLLVALVPLAASHYTFPALVVGGIRQGDWVNARMTDNHYDKNPVTDVHSANFRCYNSQTNAQATTIDVTAGSQLGVAASGNLYHAGVVNVYMAKAPGEIAGWDGSGTVWFKLLPTVVAQSPGLHNERAALYLYGDVASPTFRSFLELDTVTFTIPKNLPGGQYLVRAEAIALHDAAYYGGAQFYLSCGQINVTGGGSGTPGPLVAIPGIYTGNEPGILIDIYPIPANYTQPGPAVWRG